MRHRTAAMSSRLLRGVDEPIETPSPRPSWLMLIGWVMPLLLVSCQAKGDGGAGPRKLLSADEYDRRIEEIERFMAEGLHDEAWIRVQESRTIPAPDVVRKRLRELGQEIGESRFYNDHPLHVTLSVTPDLGHFDESLEVVLRLTNLGREPVIFPSSHRTFVDRILFREGEKAVLYLEVEWQDADGIGSWWGQRRLVEVELDRDLRIAPGGGELVRTTLVPDEPGQAVYRRLKISALYRPMAVVGNDERRYDPISFPSVTIPMIRERHARWLAGGIDLLSASVAGTSVGAPETLFLAAMGLPRGDLGQGLEVLAAAAPSLDPARRRGAIAAFDALTGESSAGDPTHPLNWWMSHGRRLSNDDLWRRSERGNGATAGEFKVGLEASRSW